MKFHEARLANGLTVVAEINDQAHSISAGYFVRTGARDETVEESGLSHFLEHMLFMGTEKYPLEDEYSSYLQRNGGSVPLSGSVRPHPEGTSIP